MALDGGRGMTGRATLRWRSAGRGRAPSVLAGMNWALAFFAQRLHAMRGSYSSSFAINPTSAETAKGRAMRTVP
jgi:hypothetical protein